ncbi:hypothetical protein E2C06_06965 [Dankookia rubra]|uniref:Uncharacterized protein n=1 Tax=Dankookia rubra TaxID=1442381 RepID=A0A4R5QJX5_9PROT|nr:hypothetical protein [Dankookia rubra]TDH63119.1 hypothetical protein E2C06_06965 [Dankookia rubra]
MDMTTNEESVFAGTPGAGTRPPAAGKGRARMAVAVALVMLTWTAAPRAQTVLGAPSNPCDGSQAPSCQQAVISGALGPDKSEYMAAYCPASAPYWWSHWTHSATHTTSFTPNPIGDSGLGKADFLLTNWNPADTSHWSIAIDCSPISPNGTCTGPTREVSDPGCPESDPQQVCDGSDNCYNEWNETCINGTTVTNYFCSQVLFVTTCFTCN